MQYQLVKGLNTFLRGLNLADGRVANTFANKLAKPYIVFMLNAGQDTNLQPRQQGDFRYAIKGVAETYMEAAQIADALRTALHEQTFTLDAPWKIDRIRHTTVIDYVEIVDDVQIYHHGGIYRIEMSEEF